MPSSNDRLGVRYPVGRRVSDGFRFSPDILARLGEELVPDADQGIIELAKNAYDADASVCVVQLDAVNSGNGTISIFDDGVGMTADTIRNGWLVIGRSAKQQKIATDVYRRVPAGDKGLGRLAALRLGERVRLMTRPASEPGVQHQLTIDWSAFASADHVEDISLVVESGPTDLAPGTDIVIESVATRFGRVAVNKLARNLLLLSDPFEGAANRVREVATAEDATVDPGFRAKLETPEFADLAAKVASGYFTDAQYRVQAVVNELGTVIFRRLDWQGQLLDEEIAGTTYDAPPMTFELWVFILDAQSFSTRSATIGEVRDWLTEVGGVHVYEDGIRVPPYGGSGNDWLEMNLRRARSPEGRPSTNTSIGLVRVTNKSGRLAQKTDRNGYIENEAFQELKRVCTDVLDWAARIQIRARDAYRRTESEKVKRATGRARSQLETVLAKSVKSTERQSVERAIEQLVKESGVEARSLRDELQLYRSLATAGMASAVFVHEIGRPLNMIDKAIVSLRRLIPTDRQEDAERKVRRIAVAKERLNSFMSIPLTLLAKRKRRSGRISVNDCVRELVSLLDPINQFFKVSVELDLTESYTDINGSAALIDGICLNLIMNAMNAFQRQGYSQENRTIRIQTRLEDSYVILVVEDNAGGIDGLEVDDIWLPGVTTSPEGTGFGLTIVRDSVADLGGAIDVIARSEFGGARFTARFAAMTVLC